MAPFGDAVGLVARTELRRRWRALLGLTLLVALVGGVSLAGFAGARRTASSLDRFREATLARDARISSDNAESADQLDAQLDDMDGVIASARETRLVFSTGGGGAITVAAATDPTFGTEVDRPLVLEGRLPDPDAADEIAIDEATVRDTDLQPGDALTVQTLDPENFLCAIAQTCQLELPSGPEEELHVTGVFRDADGLVSRDFSPEAIGSHAFAEEYVERTGAIAQEVLVRVEDRAALAQVHDLVGGVDSGSLVLDAEKDYLAFPTDAVNVLGLSLLIFSIISALAGGLLLLQAANRHLRSEDERFTRLRELGSTRRQSAIALALPPVLAAVAGALLAVVAAAPTSVWFPIAIGRRIEPDPGFRLDPLVLGLGGLILVAVFALGAVGTAWREGHPQRRLRAPRPSTLALVLARLGADPSLIGGARLAFEHRPSEGSTLIRSALLATTLGATGLVGCLVVHTSLVDLIHDPPRWGWNWDSTGTPLDPSTVTETAAAIGDEEGVAGVGIYHLGQMSIDGEEIAGHAIEDPRHIEPTVVEGRLPDGDEVALGLVTQRDLGVDIGDEVTLTDSDGADHDLEVVGTVALPTFQDRDPGVGSLFDYDTWSDLALSLGSTELVVRYDDGADVGDLEDRLNADFAVGFRHSTLPSRLDNLDQAKDVIPALAVFFGALALLGLLHALLTAVRERRAMLAMLRLLGSPRSSVRRSVLWQSEFLTISGLLIGVPLGLLVGRAVWRLIIEDLGVVDDLALDLGKLALLVPIALVATILVAATPAWLAARHRIAAALLPA